MKKVKLILDVKKMLSFHLVGGLSHVLKPVLF